MSNAAVLATRYAGRPLLLTPAAAHDLALRIRSVDAHAFERPGRLEAIFRRLGGSFGRKPGAMEDGDDGPEPVPMGDRLAYAPRWLGEPDASGFCWSLKDGVALMRVDTPIAETGDEFCGTVYHGYDTLLTGMREALADERVKGLFLSLNSPGGVVAGGIMALSDFMRSARAEAGGKPIWVHAEMACSAAYWIAAQADRVLASPVGQVGSIGVVLVHENWSQALAQAGVEVTSIEFPTGGLKTEGAWWKALSEEARANLVSNIAQCGRQFTSAVEAGRPGLTADKQLATRADVFLAEHDDPARSGLALGFVDELATEEAAFAALVADVNASGARTSSAAPGSGAASPATQETPMALKTALRGSASAAALTVSASSDADKRNRIRDLANDESVSDADFVEQVREIADEPDDSTTTEEETSGDEAAPTEEPAASAAAAAIARSAEAKTHPQLALAAIDSGQSLAQFQASVRAAGARGPGRLDGALRGAQRLGPDSSAAEGKRNGFASTLASRASARREKSPA